MLTIKQGLKISAIADKMDLRITDPNASASQLGADLIMQMVTKAHKAEQEIYAFIAEFKGCSLEEAAKLSLTEFIKELADNPGVVDFLKSAVN
jgi:hypothetical protein